MIIQPATQKKKRMCKVWGITGKQYRRFQVLKRRDPEQAETYLQAIHGSCKAMKSSMQGWTQ